MGLVKMNCPGCGQPIELDEDREVGFCSYCGNKVMVDKTIIEHTGSVKIDTSEELEKLLVAARNARDVSDAETAIRHYQKISTIDPNNWEAVFYPVMLKTETVKYGEISNAAISIINCLPKVFELINTTLQDENEKKAAVKEVTSRCFGTVAFFIRASGNYYNEIKSINGVPFDIFSAASNLDSRTKAKNESALRTFNIANILRVCGDSIERIYGLNDEFYKNQAVNCWKSMMTVHFEHIKQYKVAVYDENYSQKYIAKIKTHDPSFVVPNVKPTEKRNSTIIGILIVIGAIIVGLFWGFYYFRLFSL